MAFKVVILKRAEIEIDEAVFYHENIKKGLGKKFVSEYQKNLKTLKSIPFFQIKYNVIRTLPLKKFPYTLHISVDENDKKVFIHALTCNHQDPNTTRIKL